MTAAKRYESVWNAFLNELSHNPTATLTSFLKRCNVRQGRMKRWMENNGLSVKEAKKRLRDCGTMALGTQCHPCPKILAVCSCQWLQTSPPHDPSPATYSLE